MKKTITELPIDQVHFDEGNPRIKGALEKYGNEVDAERIHFALQNSGDEGASGASGFQRLKMSISADGGISDPIKVVVMKKRYVCVDGNTRLAIYKKFAKSEATEKWDNIPAYVFEKATPLDIEKIRVTAHLVGTRAWPAYERAKYLTYLRYETLMDYDEMIALCGGNRAEIENQMQAFQDMNDYYKDKVEDSDFRIDRFSGFVELQKIGTKDAIFASGHSLEDFGDWIRTQKIHALADVRSLPRVLRNKKATAAFLNGGVGSIKHAARVAEEQNPDTPTGNTSLKDASVFILAHTFRRKLESMTQLELDELKENQEEVETLQSLSERLIGTIDYVRK